MRLSASRIRSINRAIARAQLSVWPVPRDRVRPSTTPTSTSLPVAGAGVIKVVAVARNASS